MIIIHNSESIPEDAFVSVRYRNHGFYNDDSDLKSKRVLALMMMLFTLADTGDKEALPLIAISAQ